MQAIYYVYEHWRLDTKTCFYVGKGKGKRAYDKTDRNDHWRNTVKKLESEGFEYAVILVSENLSEETAFLLEMARIAFWRSGGSNLVNKTDGGDQPPINYASPEYSAKLSAAQKLLWSDPVYKEMMVASRTETFQSDEYRVACRNRNLKRYEDLTERAKVGRRTKERWKNSDYRKTQVQRGLDRYANPTERELSAERTRDLWEDTDYREKVSSAIKQGVNTPKEKKRRSELLKALWKDPTFRAKMALRGKKRNEL